MSRRCKRTHTCVLAQIIQLKSWATRCKKEFSTIIGSQALRFTESTTKLLRTLHRTALLSSPEHYTFSQGENGNNFPALQLKHLILKGTKSAHFGFAHVLRAWCYLKTCSIFSLPINSENPGGVAESFSNAVEEAIFIITKCANESQTAELHSVLCLALPKTPIKLDRLQLATFSLDKYAFGVFGPWQVRRTRAFNRWIYLCLWLRKTR